MNAHFRKSLNLDRSFWTILVPGDDPIGCTTLDEADHEYRSLFNLTGVHVVEFNPVEGWARDVTDDFDTDEPDERSAFERAWDAECSRADRANDERWEGVR